MTLKKNPALAYYKEAANNAAPTFNNTTSKLRLLRLVSEDLNTRFQRDESNEIRGDAQSSGSIIVSASGGGSINLQYSLDTFDDLIVGMLYAADDAGTGREDGWLQGGFTALGNILAAPGTAVTFDVADDSLNATSFTRAPAENERIYVRGFGNKNLDTIFVVDAGATTSKIPLKNDTGAADIATYAGIGANVVSSTVTIAPVKGYTRNGTFERKFGLVRFYSDIEAAGVAGTTGLATCDWALFRGAIFTGLQLAVAPGTAGWTGSISVLLKDETNISDATSASNIGGFQITDWDQFELQNSYSLANPIQSVVMVRLRKIGDAVTAATRVDPLSFNINTANGAQEIAATRNRGALDINQGTFQGSIALSLLYIDPTYHQSMLDDDAYEIEIGVADAEGHCQLWRLPKNRLTSERPNPGKNNPIQQNLTFTSEAGGDGFVGSAGTGKMLEILSFYTRA